MQTVDKFKLTDIKSIGYIKVSEITNQEIYNLILKKTETDNQQLSGLN